jgi:hypothetical protein
VGGACGRRGPGGRGPGRRDERLGLGVWGGLEEKPVRDKSGEGWWSGSSGRA